MLRFPPFSIIYSPQLIGDANGWLVEFISVKWECWLLMAYREIDELYLRDPRRINKILRPSGRYSLEVVSFRKPIELDDPFRETLPDT